MGYEPTDALLGEVGDRAAAEEEEARVDAVCMEFATTAFTAAGPEALPPETRGTKRPRASKRKRFARQKSYQALLELDNALRGPCGNGPGLRRWQLPEDWRSRPEILSSWPVVLIAGDQGPNLWRAENWMGSDLARVLHVREPYINHALHGLGAQRHGLWLFGLGMCSH